MWWSRETWRPRKAWGHGGVEAIVGAGCHGRRGDHMEVMKALDGHKTVVGWNGQRRKERTSVVVQKNSPKDRGKEKWSREASDIDSHVATGFFKKISVTATKPCRAE